jgi:tetrahydromethanopterin S-methyltransferase subunit B
MSDWRITRDGHYTPVITTNEDGTLTLDWPDGTPNTCVVAKEVMVEIVDARNDQHERIATLEALTDQLAEAVDLAFEKLDDYVTDETDRDALRAARAAYEADKEAKK